MRDGNKLCNSRLARIVLENYQAVAPIPLTKYYDFESLESAILDADELIKEADARAGTIEAKEKACTAVARILVILVGLSSRSRRLQTLMIRLTEQILDLEEVKLTIRWPRRGKDTFFNTALYGKLRDIADLLKANAKEMRR